jgi:hypothetical protein
MSVVLNSLAAGQPVVYCNAQTTAAVMTNGLSIFNTTGDILVFALLSECYTANGATASTLQYTSTNNTTSTTGNMSGASASLANAAQGVVVTAQLGAITNAPTVSSAAGVGVFPWGAVRLPGNSTIKLVIGTGSTTGTWAHYIHWQPLQDGALVTPAF